MTKGWAVVTGASSGIGLAFARELARRGHPVLAVARRRERLEALAQEAAKRGERVEALAADLKTEEGLTAVMRRLDQLGEIDLLVNNAGVATAGDFLGASLADEIGAIQLNVEAVIRLTHGVLPGMVSRGRGGIINLASVVAFQPFPHFAVYAASKAFVLSFTEALAEEVRGTGVRILALCPGAARTEIDVFAHNEGLLGKLPSLTAEQVARTAVRALDGGRVVKVVGRLNRLLAFMNRFMPRWAMRRLMGVIASPPRSQAAPDVRMRKTSA
jgi:short-subunit dehydrogenase